MKNPSSAAPRHLLPASGAKGLASAPRPAKRGEGGRRPGEGPWLLAIVVALLLAASAHAADLHEAGLKYFTDLVLTDQDGKPVRLYSDLIADKTVVINSFFASCSGSCPVMTGTFRKIQTAMADRLGRDLLLISITVDPEKDTPAALRKFARDAGAKPGWRFLTGDPKRVAEALHKLGLSTDVKENHSAVMLIGNEPKGVWKKAFGLAPPDDVVQLVQDVVAAR
jgi:protein SCO1/2